MGKFARGFWVIASFVLGLHVGAATLAVAWGDELAGTELVQSVPAETDLKIGEMRTATEVWREMIQGARSTIDLGQFYVFGPKGAALGEEFESVMEELRLASERGVKIRLVVSNAMVTNDPQTLERFRKFKGASVRILNLSKLTGGIIHAKYWIVDRKDGFLGSQNFDWKALVHIHEMGIRFRDPASVARLQAVFEWDWALSNEKGDPVTSVPANLPKPVLPASNPNFELVASPPGLLPDGVVYSLDRLKSLLAGAQRSIRVQVMDYSPVDSKSGGFWGEIDNLLRGAAVRGVKVQLLVADWSTEKPAIDHLKSLSLIPGIELKIVTVPQHSSGFISYSRVVHSKYLIVDDEALWVGTSNWSKGYFAAVRGVEMVVRKAEMARQMLKVFDRVWSQPYAVLIDVNKTYIPPKKSDGK